MAAGLTGRIGTAMTRAQSGNPTGAAAEIRQVLTELDEEPSYQRAAAEYVRAIAAHYTGDVEECLDALDACISLAYAIGEPGWEANARALRIVTSIRSGHGGDSVTDLVAAEHALNQTTDLALAGWAHTGLGYAYDLLRLFELCIPHFERAAEIDVDPLGLPESRVIDRLNLAESNLRWAHEMERLGDPTYADEILSRRDAARRWAHESTALVERDNPDGFWSVSSRMWMAACEIHTAPAAAGAVLRECRDELTKRGDPELTAIAGAYLAQTCAALGRTEEALQVAGRAVDDLPAAADPPVETMVRHTAVRIAAEAGDSGAQAGLQYARSIARGWWAERGRGLYAVRAALASHELSRRHDAEWKAAREDSLTGVGNRRALDERLDEARVSGRPIALVAIDVDNLKIVNDQHGHLRGDEVLRATARLIADQSRAGDVVARAGGDEFAVVVDNPGIRGAAEMMDRIRRAAEDFAATADRPWFASLRLSIGAASTVIDGVGVSGLADVADTRMYENKRRRG